MGRGLGHRATAATPGRAYLFGAVCPERATGAALVLPYADAAAMSLHLAGISRQVAPGAHAILVLDGAGWHGAAALAVPESITLLPLPPKSPELNPVENVRQYLRQNQLSSRVWGDGYAAIVRRHLRRGLECPHRYARPARRDHPPAAGGRKRAALSAAGITQIRSWPGS